MIIDVTGIELTPKSGNCLGDGRHFDENGTLIECCCDECDYLMCCTDTFLTTSCEECEDAYCPHVGKPSRKARQEGDDDGGHVVVGFGLGDEKGRQLACADVAVAFDGTLRVVAVGPVAEHD